MRCFITLVLLGLLWGCTFTRPSLEDKFAVLDVQIFLQCYGEKGQGPTVLLLHGIGDQASSAAWDKVVNQFSPSTLVCRYDRGGTGRSDAPQEQKRDGKALVAELHRLLETALLPPPYLLVGHSFGGYPLRLFAAAYPQDIVGTIFIDSVHERMGLLAATGNTRWEDVPQSREQLDLERIEAQVSQSEFPNTIPVYVLTRGEGVSEAWQEAQEALLSLSTKSQQRVVEGSGHEIPLEEPEAVISATNNLLNELDDVPE
jgi:pimeloyl-ACP methyl ester carboxylesterase